jgi:TolB-like protein/cytochrome c-type biogenesis protein CcmH/NrfG
VRATTDIFEFEEFRLDRQGDGLSRRGETGIFVPVSIGSRALDVLSVLVERPGELVTKEEIMAAVWRRSVVENANLTVQIAALRRVLDQARADGSCIQTVAARGYRFVVPVTRTETAAAPRTAPRLSIVVLPFTDLSEDRRQQYFADGMTDDLTTDLSRLSGMFVIARNTAFTYRDKPIGAKQIGHELGVRYVLEGSVRRLGDQVRINTQLIDSATGAHLWAERFDSAASDLLAVQNEITSRIAHTLHVELVGAEAARPIEHSDATDYILRGRAASYKAPTPDSCAEAVSWFERALELAPESVDAQSLLASALACRALDRMTDTIAEDFACAEALVRRVMAVSPRSSMAHYAYGQVLRASRRNEQAIQEYQEALAFNPSWADALADLGMCKMWVGSLDEGIALQEQAIRLSPRDPRIGLWYHRMGIAHFLQSRIAEAIPWLEKGRAMFPTFPLAYSFLAAAYALNGEVERGAAELAEHYRLSGKTWVSTIADIKVTGYWGPPKIRELYESVYFAGLRKLGVREE